MDAVYSATIARLPTGKSSFLARNLRSVYFAGRMKPESPLKVGELAARASVGVQTLHYYERLGLLPKPNRSGANYQL